MQNLCCGETDFVGRSLERNTPLKIRSTNHAACQNSKLWKN